MDDAIKSFGGMEGLERFFGTYDLDFDGYQTLALHAYKARKYATEQLTEPNYSEKDIKDYYEKNIDKISGPETRRYDMLIFYPYSKQKSWIEKQEIKWKIRKINSESDLKEYLSDHKKTIPKDIRTQEIFDTKRKSDTGNEIWDMLTTLEVGETGLFELKQDQGFYYYIIRLWAIDERVGPSFEEARRDVLKLMQAGHFKRAINDKVQYLKNKSEIQVME